MAPVKVAIPFAVRETEAQLTQIYGPTLGALQLLNNQGAVVDLKAADMTLRQRDAVGQLTALIPVTPGQMMPLPANGTLTYVYELQGQWEPGTYTGELQVAGPP